MMNINYKIALELTVKHEYYVNEVCPDIRVFLSNEDKQRLFRLSMLFKQVDINKWVILFPDSIFNNNPWEELFTFHLQITNPLLAEYTYCEEKGKCIHPDHIRVKLSDVSIREALEDKPIEEVLFFHSKEMYWKYLYMSNAVSESDRNIKLVDQSQQLNFQESKRMNSDGKQEICFVSTKPIKLKQIYDYRLQLLEVRSHGEKLLKQHLEYPQVGSYDSEPKRKGYGVLARYVY
ncbi:hypothetical protein LJC52_02890 [Bacteroidales bacterium OttesenSCG-928-A17]|nr:hypothetical protein [Bacteroidales bacterium OttesenSCG-928-A17]